MRYTSPQTIGILNRNLREISNQNIMHFWALSRNTELTQKVGQLNTNNYFYQMKD